MRLSANSLEVYVCLNYSPITRWKEECQTITRKFEAKVNELRADLSREKNRNSDLTKLLKEARDKTADVSFQAFKPKQRCSDNMNIFLYKTSYFNSPNMF